jgi:HSP20 family molecular chaperone IbpA
MFNYSYGTYGCKNDWIGAFDASKIFKDIDTTIDTMFKTRIGKGVYKQVTENEELKIIVRASGLSREDISIDIADRKLSIKNEKAISADSYLVDDIDLVFAVSDIWDDESIKAALYNGLLYITLSKANNKAKKSIHIS